VLTNRCALVSFYSRDSRAVWLLRQTAIMAAQGEPMGKLPCSNCGETIMSAQGKPMGKLPCSNCGGTIMSAQGKPMGKLPSSNCEGYNRCTRGTHGKVTMVEL
jgi:ribosomal protein S27AE